MKNLKIGIVGGGAAGIMAAIGAAKSGFEVHLYEKMPKMGKKILASGGGRCNLLNNVMSPKDFNEEARSFVAGILNRFGRNEILELFKELGIWNYTEEDGRIFPVTNQSSTVMEVLEAELARLKVQIHYEWDIVSIIKNQKGFLLKAKNTKEDTVERVMLCAGGKSYPALGADGKGYELAKSFGHQIIEPVPSTVALVTKDPWCHPLQGLRFQAKAASLVQGRKGDWMEGEVLFTQYGLSGTCILDVSEPISVAINRNRELKAQVILDMVPFLTESELFGELERKKNRGVSPAFLLMGILPVKLAHVLRDKSSGALSELAHFVKNRIFDITGTRGWNEAEFTAGGVDLGEVDPVTLESKKQKGLFLAGEILNVQGRRGGFNLAWAWSSGYIAGTQLR